MLNLWVFFYKYRRIWQLPAVIILVVGGYGVKKSGLLNPGHVSAAHPQDTPLQGYVSHADFEMECRHCHSPVHCISDDHCQECHIEVARQRAEGQGLHSRLPGTEKCQTCHREHRGSEASITEMAFQNVNHARLAGFSLELHQKNFDGASMNCNSCHTQDSFTTASVDCITCHVEADHDAMAAHIEEFSTDCLQCHDGVDRMIAFDHNLLYAIDGFHAQLECGDCHPNGQVRDTPNTCVGCHAEPELHLGIFGQDCERCHTTVAWAPAQLLQHTFLLDHDAETAGVDTCENCHAGTYTEYPCYTCHEHEDMEIAHLDHDTPNLDDCLSCHPTGRGVVDNTANTSSKADAAGWVP